MVIPRVFIGVFYFLGVGGLGLFGTYEGTKKTISYGLGEKKIPKFKKDGLTKIVWSLLSDKLKNTSKQGKDPQTNYFTNFKSKLVESNTDFSEELKNFCEDISKETYSTIFKTNELLMKDVKSFCTVNMEMAGGGNLLKASKENREEDKAIFKSKFSSLKGSNENLVNSLKRIVSEKQEDEENDWKKLADWCDESYKLSFSDDSDLLWKNVETYCWKTTNQKV